MNSASSRKTSLKALKIDEIKYTISQKNESTELMSAAKKGFQNGVKEILGTFPQSKDVQNCMGLTALMEAVNHGYVDIVQSLIESGASTNVQSKDGRTALMLASNKNKKEIVRMLLSAGATINLQNKAGKTSLSYAAGHGYKDLVQILLDSGADVNIKNEDGLTALMVAVNGRHTGVVGVLLEAGARTDLVDETGRTPLLDACYLSTPSIVKLLLSAGARDVQDKYGNTGLICAARNVCHASLSLLLKAKVDVDVQNNNGDTALLLSAANDVGMYSSVIALVNIGKANVNIVNKKGESALLLCTQHNCLKSVKVLIERGANPNVWSKKRVTPLLASFATDNPDMVDLILLARPDVNVRDEEGNTMLHYCVLPQSCQQLIRLGADVNIPNRVGVTALMRAVQHGCPQRTRLLLEAGAIAEATDKVGNTPLMYAARGGARGFISDDLENIKSLLEYGASVNASNEAGDTALLLCALREDGYSLMQALLRAGASVQVRSRSGDSPLLAAARSRNALSVDLLVKAGANVHERNEYGRTALMMATQSLGILRTLLRALANPTVQDKFGESVLSLSMRHVYTWRRHGDERRERLDPEADERALAMLVECGASPWDVDSAGRRAIDYLESSRMRSQQFEKWKARVDEIMCSAWDRRMARVLSTLTREDNIFRSLRQKGDDLWDCVMSYLTPASLDHYDFSGIGAK